MARRKYSDEYKQEAVRAIRSRLSGNTAQFEGIHNCTFDVSLKS